jgi:NADH:ubiquinone oxidoreductase subunit F (NADH-binding)
MSVAGTRPAAYPVLPPHRLPRLIAPASPLGLAEHIDRYGPVPFRDTGTGDTGTGDTGADGTGADGSGARDSAAPGTGAEPGEEWLIRAVEQAGLGGRGGAGFPAGRKMRAVAVAGRRAGPLHSQVGTVVVANGAESEPASLKDRTLLRRAPHLVLDGIALAAEAVGATRAYLCVHAGSGLAGLLDGAILARERAGLNRVPIQVTAIDGGYVASQETALISALGGGPGKPAFVPPRPSDKGAHGRPTLVQNVETLAQVALIARYGADWFRAVGDGAGSALVTVSGAVHRPGVYEIALGTPVGELVQLAGGPAQPPQAILAGGFFGGWIPFQDALSVPVSDPALRAAGAALGPGVVVLLPDSACGLAETARAVGYLAAQSAGQCGPCRNGLPALAEAFWQLAFGVADSDTFGWASQLLTLVARRGACHLPDGTAALAASALRVFDDELRRHAAYGPCHRVRSPSVLPAPGHQGRPAVSRQDGAR